MKGHTIKQIYFTAIVALIFLLIAILVGPAIKKYNSKPRSLTLASAPKDSGFLFEAKDEKLKFTALIGEEGSNNPKIKASFPGNKSVDLVMQGLNKSLSQPEKINNKLVFKNIKDGVDLTYQTLANGIKEEIILNNPLKDASQGANFSFNIDAQGVHPKKVSSDSAQLGTTFYDEDDVYVFHFAKPFMIDSKGVRSNNVILAIKNGDNNNSYQAEIIPDTDWLVDPERSYPITIDPTIVYNTTSQFATGQFDRVTDTGSGASPNLTTYYQELAADQYTVGLWHMNEASGTTAVADSSGNSLTGTSSSSTNVDTGILSNTRTFDGSKTISFPASAKLDVQKFTIEAWTYSTNFAQNGFIFEKTTNGAVNTQYSCFFATANGIIFRTYNESSVGDDLIVTLATAGVANNAWNHLACTYDGSTKKIYVNGKEVASSNYFQTLQTNAAGTSFIGTYGGGGYYFNGNIDEVRVSNVARTPEEIRMDAQRRPYSVYTSEVLDFNSATTGFNSLSWTELGVTTGDGETLKDSTSLVAQWNFNSISGTTAANNSGSCGAPCNGTLTNMTTFGPDAVPNSGWTTNNSRWGTKALMFDGTDDYVKITAGAGSSLDLDANPVTMEAWIKPDSITGEQHIISRGTRGVEGYGLAINYSSGLANVGLHGGSNFNGTTVLTPGNWYHIVGVINGASSALYVNGNLDATGTVNVTASNLDLHIGSSWNGSAEAYFFDGIIDSTRLYSRALTAAEILSNYNAGNVELQTRVGADTTPNDGSWEAWKPTTSETTIASMDSDATNWVWDNSATYMPQLKSNESNIKVEGTGSLKLNVGRLQADANTIGLWHLDETGGTGAYLKDSTANANHGTPTGSTVINGVSGKARSFNGSSDVIIVIDSTELRLGVNQTVEAWVKPTTNIGDWTRLVGKGDATNRNYGIWRESDGDLLFQIYGTSNCSSYQNSGPGSTGNISLNQWSYIVGTYDGTNIKSYVNGVLVNTTACTSTPYTSAHSLTIGYGNGDGTPLHSPFSGNIDEVRISNVARTAEEIAESYRAGRDHYINKTISSTDLSSKISLPFYIAGDRPGTYLSAIIGESAFANYQPDANTVGLWHLDETSNSLSKLKDSSGNANDGAATFATGGTITYSGGYTIHTFNSSGTLTTLYPNLLEALVVAGGGAGGGDIGGGGGGGGVLNGTLALPQAAYSITVGNGGTAPSTRVQGPNGGNSVFSTLTAVGGGGGGYYSGSAGSAGGSGGGGGAEDAASYAGGAGTGGQGNNGGSSAAGTNPWMTGGGGGAGAVGVNGTTGNNSSGNGGNGISSTISGASVTYGGGGGGGSYAGGIAGSGGTGGGGGGAVSGGSTGGSGTATAQSGTANTGGGGGGARYTGGSGLSAGSGGSGVVIARYPSAFTGTAVQGKIGKGRSFNGTTDYIYLGTSTSYNLTTYSISGWFKTSGLSTYQVITSKNTAATARNWWISVWANGGGTNPDGSLAWRSSSGGVANGDLASTRSVADGQWHHFAIVLNGTTDARMYIDGKLEAIDTSVATPDTPSTPVLIGNGLEAASRYFSGSIDEVRIDNTARTADEIRQAFEVGARTHLVTIDFGAKLDSGNLITGSGDLGFTVDATYYGLNSKGNNLYLGDKIIVRENVGGTEYIAQGTVTAVTASTGAVTVSAWDSGGTFPAGGFTVNADVFKWQREYFDLGGSLSTHRNAVTNLTFRLTNGDEGRTIWLDDLKSAGNYLSTPAGSTITSSSANQYFQYRAIQSTSDYNVSSSVTATTTDFATNAPNPPTHNDPSNIAATSIQWNFTGGGGGLGGITGFKVYDTSNVLKKTCTGAAITSCVETGLTPNTSYTRKVAAYNASGISLFSLTKTALTLAAVPPIPTTSSATATTLSLAIGGGTNPSNTQLAAYQETGAACDGVGGNYLAANGSTNGSTAVWQTAAAWGTLALTGRNLEANQYSFCVKARNSNNAETAFSSPESNNGGWIPLSGNFTMTQSMSFTNKYVDYNNPGRWVSGLDVGVGSTNSSVMTLQSGVLTVGANETVVAGSFVFPSGSTASIVLPTDGSSYLKPGQPLWIVDADSDGYPSVLKLGFGTAPAGNRRRNVLSTLNTTTDCNDSLSGHNNTLASTYYVDGDADNYTNSGTSAGTAVCSSASTWDTATSNSVPGVASTNSTFTAGARKNSASATADCNDADANIRTVAATSTGTYTTTDAGGYRIHKYTGNGSFNLTCGTPSVEYLVVAGGGGSGGTVVTAASGGGGGAGGMLSGTIPVNTGSYTVTVGEGGAAGSYSDGSSGTNGNNSVWNGITAIGGGGGGGGRENSPCITGLSGGSGGGGGGCVAGGYISGGSGNAGQGYSGGTANAGQTGAAGGGAGGAGLNSASGGGSTGGLGLSSSISGSPVTYATGGTGALWEIGTANLGNGGGGKSNSAGKSGGSGVVIIRYANP